VAAFIMESQLSGQPSPRISEVRGSFQPRRRLNTRRPTQDVNLVSKSISRFARGRKQLVGGFSFSLIPRVVVATSRRSGVAALHGEEIGGADERASNLAESESCAAAEGRFLASEVVFLRPLGKLAAKARLVPRQFTSYVGTAAAAKRRYKDAVVPGSASGVLPRAERFAIETTIRYRIVGHEEWHQGKRENISGSGVLCRARNLLAHRTRVEMAFRLPKVGPRAGVPASSALVKSCAGYRQFDGEQCPGWRPTSRSIS